MRLEAAVAARAVRCVAWVAPLAQVACELLVVLLYDAPVGVGAVGSVGCGLDGGRSVAAFAVAFSHVVSVNVVAVGTVVLLVGIVCSVYALRSRYIRC